MIVSRFKKALCLTSLLSVAFSTYPCAPQTISYKEIGDPLIAAIGFVDKEKKELTEKEKAQALQKIAPLSDGEKLKLVFEILEANGYHNPSTIPAISYQAMKTTTKELELFFAQGANSQNHLFSKINHTSTSMGQAILAKMLVEPLDDLQQLRNRQAFVRELVNNETLFNELNDLLKSLATKESDLLSFWQKNNPISEHIIKQLYVPKLTSLNASASALTLWRTLVGTAQCAQLMLIALPGIFAAKSAYYAYQLKGCKNPDQDTMFEHTTRFTRSLYQTQNYWRFGYLPKAQRDELAQSAQMYKQNPAMLQATFDKFYSQAPALTFMMAGSTGLCFGAGIYTAAKTVGNIQQVNTALKYMQTRLSGMATLLTTAEKLHALVAHNDAALHGLFMQHMGIEHLEQQKQKLQKLQTLVNYLETKTFAGDYSFFSNSGRILAAFNLIQEFKNEFVGLMQAVGEIDAYLSVAKLYKELHNNQNATYCFVEYVEQDTPYLYLENFWNPIIDPSIVVTNSLELGGSQSPRNIVVTGSNTGGKSTILKAVVASIMFSRLGIAPASKAVMTPFTYLATSMNIGDDTASGISLFKAEVLRAKSILDNVRSLQPHEHAFLAIDELFVGTASEKGEEAACKFAETLSAQTNTIFTFATHFKKATELEQKTAGQCINYKVEAFKNDNGDIVRPFKLEPGISTSNIANDILQENISSIDFM